MFLQSPGPEITDLGITGPVLVGPGILALRIGGPGRIGPGLAGFLIGTAILGRGFQIQTGNLSMETG